MGWGEQDPHMVPRPRYNEVISERDAHMRTINRLTALIAKHTRKDFCDEADEALHAGYERVLKDIGP